MYHSFLVTHVWLAVCLLLPPGVMAGNKLMIVLLDGFRWDYFDRNGLDGFQNFLSNGTRAEYLKNSFPTISYPNYYTMMTGLYSEDHGFIDNVMYDPIYHTEFLVGTNREQYDSYWWDDGDPLWITAKRQNKKSFFYFWPGCEVMIRKLKPDYCRIYKRPPSVKDFRTAIKDGLDDFTEKAADLIAIYFELTDKIAHNFGPNSTELQDVLIDVSNIIDDLMIQLKAKNLDDEVNVILMSDHGMSEISPDRVIDLNPILNPRDIRHMYGSVFLSLWPSEDKIEKVYDSLKYYHKHLKVYLKEEIPERWRLKHHYRIPPIVALADNGWYILKPPDKHFPVVNGVPIRGYHGYDNKEVDMRGIFAASGPDFKRNEVVPWINAVDLYQLFCEVLEIKPSPNRGNWDNVEPMLLRAAPLPPPYEPPPPPPSYLITMSPLSRSILHKPLKLTLILAAALICII